MQCTRALGTLDGNRSCHQCSSVCGWCSTGYSRGVTENQASNGEDAHQNNVEHLKILIVVSVHYPAEGKTQETNRMPHTACFRVSEPVLSAGQGDRDVSNDEPKEVAGAGLGKGRGNLEQKSLDFLNCLLHRVIPGIQ